MTDAIAKRWPAKPEGSRWTDEQWAAIAADGSHLLVAAAAGSGKTAVLVERIISRIADEERPLDVDSMLVATFTKAAAAEMKERIRHALEEALERNPDSGHLQRQLALLPRATITTLHSFCMEVVERYSPVIGLDPGFRIANDTEAELLRMDTLDELFEELYSQEEEAGADEGADKGEFKGELSRLADRFGGERTDEPLHRLVLELHEFAGSHPWPEHWLRQMAGRFNVDDASQLIESLWVSSLRADALLTLRGALHLLDAGLRLTMEPGGPAPYADALRDDRIAVETIVEAMNRDSWSDWRDAIAACSFGRLKPCKGDDYDPELQERTKAYRDTVKKTIAKLSEEWLVRSPEKYAEELRAIAPDMSALAELAISFGQRYELAKREKGLLDFGDLEHYALRILREPSSTAKRSAPSVAAADYRDRYSDIYLDEYQDTNEVQEAIVSLIARSNPGNVFMVGDVKQSIYRFRLAEPGLFLAKYRTYDIWTPETDSPADEGLRIDLARNFRSRREIVEAVNHVFRLIMREPVGEMTYDRRAELVYGNGYPDAGEGDPAGSYGLEMILIDAAGAKPDAGEFSEASEGAGTEEQGDDPSSGLSAQEEEDAETAQLEARCIAAEIRNLMGADDGTGDKKLPFAVYDGKAKLHRPVQYRDIVILLRAATSLAPAFLEELKAAGIPAYADLATGYFAATEVDVMLSLLAIIDNPRQDIPLAGVLRSPIVGLSAEELAQVRLRNRKGSFWDAATAVATVGSAEFSELDAKTSAFVLALESWRSFARKEPLGELLEMLYRETGYYDFVGGMPGGVQRQANLRALVDRARDYERSSRFRGLFRFLRFLGRMRDTGSDLGAARAIGESENVVRIVSIHKSKGLEFPVVFAAGLGRKFNRKDLSGMFLKHKTLGFGPRMVETDTRVTYPTLPQLAIRRKLAGEMLAEEMRVLYVALTRPKEKLYLIGTSKDAAKEWRKWEETASMANAGLPDYAVASASRYLDWLGPAAVLSGGGAAIRSSATGGATAAETGSSASGWNCRIVPSTLFTRQAADAAAALAAGADSEASRAAMWNALVNGESVPTALSADDDRVRRLLSWRYPHEEASAVAAKTSITAMKEKRAYLTEAIAVEEAESEDSFGTWRDRAASEGWTEEPPFLAGDHLADDAVPLSFRMRRPKFLSAKRLTAAERGTAFHLVMQHLPLAEGTGKTDVVILLDSLTEKRILSPDQRKAVDPGEVAAFCDTSLYRRLCAAERVWREVPFTYGLRAEDIHPGSFGGSADETVIIQGVVDCLFAEGDGLVLVDYKTDFLEGTTASQAAEKHRFQVERYGEAAGRILGQPVKEAYVYFFDGGQAVRLW
ncbi:helicase-exonuclease AddAB subunit AddA [Cohnella faecalis]|uniref:ATP-dependent helicase/nuclease subunit A n=1 Tax=Cohnella faecalis TaxID=2315694 RepID=A0A398CZ36_9BACL|nr:helicase-exonuclease AddAB subunit AddA [Cohnella faecalis]RIE04194.1 helicase-exonuclease AddAB subunit AddA [Cohnella faecalis]